MFLEKYILPSLNIKSGRNIITLVAEEKRIPRILHQTFHSKILPQVIQKNIDKIKVMNPEWEYRFYDDEDIVDFIKKNYDPQIINYFNRINPIYGAAKADLFRYLLMYKCGGVYIDIKSSLRKPLNDILKEDDRYLLSGWKDNETPQFDGWGVHAVVNNVVFEEYQQWYIVAAPGHPFLKAVIENVLRNIENYIPSLHGVGKPGVLNVTGPVAYTLAIKPLLHFHHHRIVHSQSDLGFEYSIFRSNDGHNSLFKMHYTDLSEPVINIEGTRKVLTGFIRILKESRALFLS